MQAVILFKNHLWKDRCERIIKWEKSCNITVQDKRSPIRKHRSKTNNTDRHVTNDEVLVLDGPDPITPLMHAPISDSPKQRFHKS